MSLCGYRLLLRVPSTDLHYIDPLAPGEPQQDPMLASANPLASSASAAGAVTSDSTSSTNAAVLVAEDSVVSTVAPALVQPSSRGTRSSHSATVAAANRDAFKCHLCGTTFSRYNSLTFHRKNRCQNRHLIGTAADRDFVPRRRGRPSLAQAQARAT